MTDSPSGVGARAPQQNQVISALNTLSAAASFLDDLGSMGDESIAEADPALLGSYRDDAARLRDALLRAHDTLSPIVAPPAHVGARAPIEPLALERKIAQWREMSTPYDFQVWMSVVLEVLDRLRSGPAQKDAPEPETEKS